MLRLAQEQYGPLFCRDLGSKSQIWGPNLKASRPKKIENFPENRLVKEKFMTPPWWDRRLNRRSGRRFVGRAVAPAVAPAVEPPAR